MANLALNQNQTFQTPVLGMVTMDPQPNTVSAILNPDSVAPVISVGQAVKLLAADGPQIMVDVCSAVTDPVFGVIPFNLRKNLYKGGDIVEVVARGGILMMKSSGAIPRGSNVAITNQTVLSDDPTVAVNVAATNAIAGVALGQASGADQLIKVQVAPGINSAGGVVDSVP